MGTWKKMAEAFGRATGQTRDFGGAKQSALKAWHEHRDDALGDEFRKGYYAGRKDLNKAEARAKDLQDDGVIGSLEDITNDEVDLANDVRTDKNLRQNASDEWDEAFARRKQGVRDWYGKDYPQDMAEEGAEAFEKQLWDLVDELKAKGVSAQDILDRIKGND